MPIMDIITLIVTSSAIPILITHVEIYTNLDTKCKNTQIGGCIGDSDSIKIICMH